jgi:PAS domain S-box-containing protein
MSVANTKTPILTDLLFEKADVGLCLVAPDSTIVRANADWLRSTGLVEEQVVGENIIDLFPATRDMALAMHARARAGHRVEVPRHAQVLNGRDTWWEGSIEPVPMEGGTGLLISAREIVPSPTSVEHAPSAEELRLLVASVKDYAIFMLARDGTVKSWNLGSEHLEGYRSEEIIGQHFSCFYTEADRRAGKPQRELQLAVEQGRLEHDGWRVRKDGSRFWANVVITALRDDAGELRGFAKVTRDMTDRRRAEDARREHEIAEEALGASEQRYRTLFNSIDEGFCVVEVSFDAASKPIDYRFLEVNKAFERQTGLVNAEGQWMRTLAPAHEEHWFQIYGKVALTGEPVRFENRAEALHRWYDVYAFRVGAPQARQVGILFNDITVRKKEEAARESGRRKDEFLAMLSHELRNPLAPIRNSTYILQHAEPGSEQARRAQEVIQRQTEHLTRLVDDLLDVTRIARGKIELRRSRIDLREVVARAADDFWLALHDRGVRFDVHLPDRKLWADADATRITQIVCNLLHNASKFTRKGEAVTVELELDMGAAIIRVRDTGAGIDPELLPHIFEVFVQGERTLDRSDGGLGLGLALVKGLVELHGGTVHADSAGKEKGAVFSVRLPLTATLERVARSGTRADRTNVVLRVLVVDDNADAAESLADLVRMLGHSAEVSYDGATAIERVRADPPNVVLCDIGLPGTSGYDVARALRALMVEHMQLIAVSGYAQPEDVQRAIEAGFDGHIAKPADPAQLERLLG